MPAQPPASAPARRPLPSGHRPSPLRTASSGLPSPAVSRTSPPLPSLTSPGCYLSPHPVSRGFTTAPSADAPVLCTSARHTVAGALSAGQRLARGGQEQTSERGGQRRQSDTLRVARQLLRELEREMVSARLGARPDRKPAWGQPAWDWRSLRRGPGSGPGLGEGASLAGCRGAGKEARRSPRTSTKLRPRKRARKVSGLVCCGKKHCLPQPGLKRKLLTVTNYQAGPWHRLQVGWCGQKGARKEAGMGAERSGGRWDAQR